MPLIRYEADGASFYRRRRDFERTLERKRAAEIKVKAPPPSYWITAPRMTPAVFRQLVRIAGDKKIDARTRARANARILQLGTYDTDG